MGNYILFCFRMGSNHIVPCTLYPFCRGGSNYFSFFKKTSHCHLYSNHIDQAKEQINRDSYELSELIINDEFWNPDTSFLSQIDHIQPDDFYIKKYESHARIKAPLSN